MKTKVILRPWVPTDAEALVTIANNKNIYNNLRNSFPSPYTQSDAVNWIAYAQSQEPIENYAITSNGQLTGSIGYIPGKDIYGKTAEIGYFIGEVYWGGGIATEAIRQLIWLMAKSDRWKRIEAHVFEQNKSSMKVLEKNDFYLEAIKKNGAYKNDSFMDEYVWVKLLS